jgi:Quinohemoprotein amine dehydrogenase, gamma subunit
VFTDFWGHQREKPRVFGTVCGKEGTQLKHLKAINKKARRIDGMVNAMAEDVVALQNQAIQPRPHVPMGCALAFSPGWEVDSAGGTAGLCQPVERDIYDCYVTCFWPAQVPDHLNNYPDWASKCASATKDWRNLDLVFP